MVFVCPPKDCAQCPRLVEFRKGNMAKFPDVLQRSGSAVRTDRGRGADCGAGSGA